MIHNFRHLLYARQPQWRIIDSPTAEYVQTVGFVTNECTGHLIFNGTDIIAGRSLESSPGVVKTQSNLTQNIIGTQNKYNKLYYNGTQLAFTTPYDSSGGLFNTNLLVVNPSTFVILGSELISNLGSAGGVVKSPLDNSGTFRWIVFSNISKDGYYWWYAEPIDNPSSLTPVNNPLYPVNYVVTDFVNNSFNAFHNGNYFLTRLTSNVIPTMVTGYNITHIDLSVPVANKNWFGGNVIDGKAWYFEGDGQYVIAYDVNTLAYEYWNVAHLTLTGKLSLSQQSKIDNFIYFGTSSGYSDYVYYCDPVNKTFVRMTKGTAFTTSFWAKAFNDQVHGFTVSTNNLIKIAA